MRGLTLFITELRKCKGKEEELKIINKELAKIRKKFKGDKPINGYDKKKCVCKLLFMFLLGRKIDIGMMEAVNLLSSNAYSEKQIGYLFISVVLKEDHNLLPLVVNALKADLSSMSSTCNNLALQFIANNASEILSDSLKDQVLEILFANDTVDFVKQTASLTLLQLLRVKPNIFISEYKISRIVSLISHHNLGIVTTSACLLEFLAKNFTSHYESCVPQCVVRLHRIIMTDATEFRDYTYYHIGAPWLTVKLLRILQNFSVPIDPCLKSRLKEFLESILGKAREPPKGKKFEHNNLKYAIIFEAISLIIQMEFEESLLLYAFNVLGNSLNQKDANIRFMALDLMTKLSNIEIYRDKVKSEWEFVLKVLKSETDITIKKQAIDLLYIICDSKNVTAIVEEMLYFLECEPDTSVDIVLKTAALAEQFGTNQQWYVDTILSMLQISGEKVNDNVWYTLVNTVIDNPCIHEYAARASFAALLQKNCQDSLIKVAGYILGEFGYLIAKDPVCNHIIQLSTLKEKYMKCSVSAKALLLTTFMKFYNMYPDLKHQIHSILRNKCNIQSEDEEIQQRTVEYLTLSEIATKRVLATVLEVMPSNNRKESSLLTAIEKINSQKSEPEKKRNKISTYISFSSLPLPLPSEELCIEKRIHLTNSVSHSDLLDNNIRTNLKTLADIFKNSDISDMVSETFPTISKSIIRASRTTSNETFLGNFLFNENAVLYEDDVIMIILEGGFMEQFGRFHLKYINKTMNDFSDLIVRSKFDELQYKCSLWFKPMHSVLHANGEMEQDIHLECLDEFTVKPSLNLSFYCRNEHREVKIILPLTLNKFIEPALMTAEAFQKRWGKYNIKEQEFTKDFPAKYPMVRSITREKLKRFRLHVIENDDAETFYCAGIFYSRSCRIGLLIQLKQFPQTNRYYSSVRSSRKSLSENICNLLFDLL